jgi:trans-aconitate methyltransferase
MTLAGTFWQNNGLSHIVPPGGPCPEGFDPGAAIAEIVGDRTATEVGCGVGRLASAFDAGKYVGVDINESAIEAAQKTLPHYVFKSILEWGWYPSADVVFMYTVALHVDDESIQGVLERAASAALQQVVIAEIMDRKWRRPGTPPVFNRDPAEYVDLMAEFEFTLTQTIARPYAHYANNWAARHLNKSTDLTILVFDRNK